MTPLEEIIRAEIAAFGPMRFERFMEQALYHPTHGYYTKSPVIGRAGDFYTSVSVGPLFGRLLALQFYRLWLSYNRGKKFWIIEQGAHDGQLARDILEWCRTEAPDFFETLSYGMVGGPSVEGTTTFPDLAAAAAMQPTGVFLSNELVDAFPVRAVIRRNGEWRERTVTIAGERLDWDDQPITDSRLLEAMHLVPLPDVEGYVTEIHLRAWRWMGEVAAVLESGCIFTIDYGYGAADYYASHRSAGTLTSYRNHQRVGDVLAAPGEQDISAHVEFASLGRMGREAGLKTLGRVNQQRFLTGIAEAELRGGNGPHAGVIGQTRAFQTLTHPQHLGAQFQVLVQAKNGPEWIEGLRYARQGRLP